MPGMKCLGPRGFRFKRSQGEFGTPFVEVRAGAEEHFVQSRCACQDQLERAFRLPDRLCGLQQQAAMLRFQFLRFIDEQYQRVTYASRDCGLTKAVKRFSAKR